MYQKQSTQESSPSPRSKSGTKELKPSGSYGSLSEVVQKAQREPSQVGEEELQQLDSAVGTRATGEILARGKNPMMEFKGLSTQLWGNRSVGGVPIQTKLTIGAVGDKYEQEADRVAAAVVKQINRPQLSVQGEMVEAKERKKEGEVLRLASVQRQDMGVKEAPTELVGAINQTRGGGQPLDEKLQVAMGQAMGADFSNVRVHTDVQADRMSKQLQAKAFTTGNDVYFRQGEYQQGSRAGQELIAHELTHREQQNELGGKSVIQRAWNDDPKDACEHLDNVQNISPDNIYDHYSQMCEMARTIDNQELRVKLVEVVPKMDQERLQKLSGQQISENYDSTIRIVKAAVSLYVNNEDNESSLESAIKKAYQDFLDTSVQHNDDEKVSDTEEVHENAVDTIDPVSLVQHNDDEKVLDTEEVDEKAVDTIGTVSRSFTLYENEKIQPKLLPNHSNKKNIKYKYNDSFKIQLNTLVNELNDIDIDNVDGSLGFQGRLGNCWCVASIMALAIGNNEKLKSIIKKVEWEDVPGNNVKIKQTFKVTFFNVVGKGFSTDLTGNTEDILVDMQLPVQVRNKGKEKQLVYAGQYPQTEASKLVSLIEKSFASSSNFGGVVGGDYGNLKSNFAPVAFMKMTGEKPLRIQLNGFDNSHIKELRSVAKANKFWGVINGERHDRLNPLWSTPELLAKSKQPGKERTLPDLAKQFNKHRNSPEKIKGVAGRQMKAWSKLNPDVSMDDLDNIRLKAKDIQQPNNKYGDEDSKLVSKVYKYNKWTNEPHACVVTKFGEDSIKIWDQAVRCGFELTYEHLKEVKDGFAMFRKAGDDDKCQYWWQFSEIYYKVW